MMNVLFKITHLLSCSTCSTSLKHFSNYGYRCEQLDVNLTSGSGSEGHFDLMRRGLDYQKCQFLSSLSLQVSSNHSSPFKRTGSLSTAAACVS